MPVRSPRGVPTRAPVAPLHRGPGATTSHDSTSPNAALLIDFDNVTMGIRSDLQTELRNLLSSAIVKGKVAVQRAYADWRRYPQYIVPLSESSIDLIFAPAYGSSKKNATDIRLAVDAIELVFTRPEIGTFILLSGDSDFSSLVLKLKEYGKYVIGVGIRESSSDLLVQNCDEYYSYNALAGLVKTNEEEVVKWDPWELVVEAIGRMQKNGDVMRSDRLKQVMQEIDPNFDEKNLGMAKFSRFCLDASQRGLLKVTKLENGQLEVAPGEKAPAAVKSEARAAAPVADGAAAEPREGGRSRRGRRGRGRDRDDRPRADSPAGEGAAVADTSAPAVTTPVVVAPIVADLPPVDDTIGRGGERLSRDEAFDLVKRAVAAVVTGEDPVPAELVRQKAFVLLGRDSESLADRMFSRILRDAHDASLVDLRKRGHSYEVSPAAVAPSVIAQLDAVTAAQDAAAAAAAPIVPRSITGRRGARGKGGEIPADLLSIGVVEMEPVATPVKASAAKAEPKAKVALKAAAPKAAPAAKKTAVKKAAPKAKKPAAKKKTVAKK